MSIEKSISPTLSNLIAEANYTIESVKEKILKAYDYAINIDGYTPLEAAKILRDNLDFSDRYIRECLPLEAKDQSKKKLYLNHDEEPAPQNLQENKENVENITTNDSLENIPEERERPLQHIPTAYDIKEAESETIPEDVEDLRGNKTELIPDNVPPYIKLKLDQFDTTEQLLKESLEKISELENKLQDKSFEVIKNSRDTVKNGTYDLEIKDKIIPLKWNFSLTTDRMVISLDVDRARRMGI